MVHRRDDGQAERLQAEEPVPETLDVVDDVELPTRPEEIGHPTEGAHAEGEGLRQETDPTGCELVEVERAEDLERVFSGHDLVELLEDLGDQLFGRVDLQ